MFAGFAFGTYPGLFYGLATARALIAIAGVPYVSGGPGVLYESLTIVDSADEQPTTCNFTTWLTVPTVGQDVIVALGDLRIFAGQIQTVTQRYWEKPATNIFADVTATDYTAMMNRRKFTGRFLTQSASIVAAAIVATVPGFSGAAIQAGLPTIDEITFTFQNPTDCLTQLMKRIGGYWYCDYERVVHVFLTEVGQDPTPLTPTHPTLDAVASTRDLSQVVTRVLVEGGGVNAAGEAPAGETILPVDDVAWYSRTGGVVVAGPQRLTYAGLSLGGVGSLVGPAALPGTQPTLTLLSGAGLGVGVYLYAYTYVTAAGESLPSQIGSIVTQAALAAPTAPSTVAALGNYTAGWNVGDSVQYAMTFITAAGETTASPLSTAIIGTAGPSYPPYLNAITVTLPVGSGVVTGRRLYRYVNGVCGGYAAYPPLSPASVVDYSFGGTMNFGANPGTAPPVSNTTAAAQVTISDVALGPASVTARKIYRTAVGGSQLKLQQTIANNTATVGVTDVTADGSLGANAPTLDTAGLTAPLTEPANAAAAAAAAFGNPTAGTFTTAANVASTAAVALNIVAASTSGAAAAKFTTAKVAWQSAVAALTAAAAAPTNPATVAAAVVAVDRANAASTSALNVEPGSTVLIVANSEPFSSTGGWVILSGGQLVRYAGITTNTLTGLPASGVGAILTTVLFGTQVLPATALVGIPASGAGSIVVPILKGDPINILVAVNDLTGQAILATLFGGGDDGVIEDYFQDRRLSITEATARGNAQLALRGRLEASLRYTCRDPYTRAGGSITVNLPAPTNVAAVFRVQRVTFSQFDARGLKPPSIAVEASSNRFSFEDLLRLAGEARRFKNL